MERLEQNINTFNNEPKTFKDFFLIIKDILKDWIDFSDERYYDLVSCWILGTYMHEKFVSYPYLFLNAMKSSGKSRLLRLINELSNEGRFTASLTEAVLFRLPSIKKITMCIDEAENIHTKEKQNLRLLLNSAYKEGLTIYRARKVSKSEQWIMDEFNIFVPIAIANIEGLDDVLEDRCIPIFIERSMNEDIISKPEWFKYDNKILSYKHNIKPKVSALSVGVDGKMIYICSPDTTLTTPTYTTTLTTLTTLTILNTQNIIKKGIIGRDLEIWYPLFWIAVQIDNKTYENLESLALEKVLEKKETDLTENRDLIFISFIFNNYASTLNYTNYTNTTLEYTSVKDIVSRYKLNEPDDKWFDSRWVGRAIKRHRLAISKRRMSKGFEILINFDRLNQLAKKFNIKKEESASDNLDLNKEKIEFYSKSDENISVKL